MRIANSKPITKKEFFVTAALKVRGVWDCDPRTKVIPNKKKAANRKACRKGVNCYA